MCYFKGGIVICSLSAGDASQCNIWTPYVVTTEKMQTSNVTSHTGQKQFFKDQLLILIFHELNEKKV